MPRVRHPRLTRIASVEPCEVEYHAGRRLATTWNVSLLGLYLVVDPSPEVGESIRLSFRLPNDPEPIRADGRVIWRNPPSAAKGVGTKAIKLPAGCGVEFVTLDADDRRRIESHVKETVIPGRL
jgi:Tfp pilus assembly protein PilZ